MCAAKETRTTIAAWESTEKAAFQKVVFKLKNFSRTKKEIVFVASLIEVMKMLVDISHVEKFPEMSYTWSRSLATVEAYVN